MRLTAELDRYWLMYLAGGQDEAELQLKKLLEPFGIKRFCTDGWGAYQRHLPAHMHEVGKRKTQTIERKHLRLRTRIKRLARRTICFSKSEEMHDLVIGLLINRYEARIINLRANNKSITLPLKG